MKSAILTEGPPSRRVLVFETGEEVVSTLTGWAAENNLPGSSFTGVGAFREATLRPSAGRRRAGGRRRGARAGPAGPGGR